MEPYAAYEKEVFSRASLPLNSIAVIYCTSSISGNGREIEKLADCEVIEVASAVQAALQEKGYQVELVNLDPGRIADLRKYDWVFNLAETIDGYPLTDYEVAGQMEQLNINFTGCGSQALRKCLDKAGTKSELLRCGITTPDYQVLYPGDWLESACRYPVMVKPVHEDSSIGITNQSIARNDGELAVLVEKIHHVYAQAALVEAFIEGRDITVSILGNGEDAVVFPPSGITYPKQGGCNFLTFEAKWVTGSPAYQQVAARCPCDLSPDIEAALKEIALQAYRIMDCRDYARVDFRLDGDTPYVLEVNPNPCINPDDSGFIRSANAGGFTYQDVIHRILKSSLTNACKIGEPFTLRRCLYEHQDEKP